MKTEELYEIVKNGKRPIVQIQGTIKDFMDDSFDPLMMGRIVEVSQEFEDSYRFLIDMNGFEEHNRSVASHDWFDKEGNPTLTWLETNYYPKDGREPLYLPIGSDLEIPLKIIEDNTLLSEYLESNPSKTYIEWLEKEVLSLRQSANSK